MANFCPSCGNKIEPGDRFCPSCRTELSVQSVAPELENLKKAFEEIRCELSLDEVFRTLGFGKSDLIDWREAKWSRRMEEESMLRGLFFLTRENIFFIMKAIWPSKLSKKMLETNIVVMPVSAVREVRAGKSLFSRKFKTITIKGLIKKRGVFFRKERWTKETFFLENSDQLAKEIKSLSPNIKGRI